MRKKRERRQTEAVRCVSNIVTARVHRLPPRGRSFYTTASNHEEDYGEEGGGILRGENYNILVFVILQLRHNEMTHIQLLVKLLSFSKLQ